MDDSATPVAPKTKSIHAPRKKKAQPVFTVVNRPIERYAIQKAFVDKGLYLVNPATYKYLNGFLNAPSIYLTFVPPSVSHNGKHNAFGFIPLESPQKEKDNLPPKELKIDATLYFYYPTDEYVLGLGQDGIFHVVIQTWHDAEIEKWEKIAHDVALQLSTCEDGSVIQTVKFYITSTILPIDPDASHQLIIKPQAQFLDDAVSNANLQPYEEDFWDE